MEGLGSDSAAAERLLATALDDPAELEPSETTRAADLLKSDKPSARTSAAWVLGLAAADDPETVLGLLPRIAKALEKPDCRRDAGRVLGYLGRHNPQAIAERLEELESERLRERCREAIWGQTAPRTVVDIPEEEPPESDSRMAGSLGGAGSDHWGWNPTSGTASVESTETERRRPPTERPTEPEQVDLPHDAYEVVATVRTGDAVDVGKAMYYEGESPNVATLHRFTVDPTEEFLEAFERRAASWAGISDHEAVVPVVDWGREPGAWLATEHVTGGDINQLAGPENLDATLWTLEKVADALAAAHRMGVTHGGLTPASIVRIPILSEPDAWAFPRVTGWGIAPLFREPTDKSTVPTRYAAPEMLAPEEFGNVDAATDIYQFGVVAYEALTGRPPFVVDERPLETAILEADPPDVSESNPAVPEALDAVLSKCLAGRKPRRFESAGTMRAQFRDAGGL